MGTIDRRGRIAAVGLALAGLLGTPALAGDSASAVMQPSSPWVMDYADDSCTLRRTFGPPEQPVWLELRQFAPGDEFLATVATSGFKMWSHTPTARFLPDGPPRKQVLAAYGKYGDGLQGVSFPDTLRPIERDDAHQPLAPWPEGERSAQEKAVTGLSLQGIYPSDLVLETGTLHPPMEAMRTCLDDLLKTWGIDPETNRALASPALQINQRDWQQPIVDIFPRDLFKVSGNPRATFRLLIDDTGKVESCKVLRPAVGADYEKKICTIILQKAKYIPAISASGAPVKSVYLLNIIYSH